MKEQGRGEQENKEAGKQAWMWLGAKLGITYVWAVTTSRRPCLESNWAAFTKLEFLVVVAVLAIIAGLLLPALAKAKSKPQKINCVVNLKNIGLGLRIFAADNNGQYPWGKSVTNGGSAELLCEPWSPLPHFLALSNELNHPRILTCPSDSTRQWARSFPVLTAGNLSYFLGFGASEDDPESVLSGDRNLTWNGTELKPGLAVLTTNGTVGFSQRIHSGGGNLLLGDGSVRQGMSPAINDQFRRAFATGSTNAMTLLVP